MINNLQFETMSDAIQFFTSEAERLADESTAEYFKAGQTITEKMLEYNDQSAKCDVVASWLMELSQLRRELDHIGG